MPPSSTPARPDPNVVVRLSRGDGRYPRLLREIQDSPAKLYVRGNLVDAPHVTIVGSRACTRYGREIATELARRGVSIVSGMARGIDAAAHEGALAVGGHTVAVLPAGLNPVYPRRHHHLAERIASCGALVTELDAGTRVAPWHFPQRNRIIAGMSEITVVVEAAAKSGARITADLALTYNRDVLVVPGPITSRTSVGCHQLMNHGAFPCTGVEDVIRHLKEPAALRKSGVPACNPDLDSLSSSERALLLLLRPAEPRQLDELGLKLDLPIDVLLVAATGLEIRELVVLLPGNRIEAR
jgi:DNA processing protein